VGRNRAEAHGRGRVRFARPGPSAIRARLVGILSARAMDDTLLGEDGENLSNVVPAELLRDAERQLERRALHMTDQDVEIIGIDQRALRRSVEEVAGV